MFKSKIEKFLKELDNNDGLEIGIGVSDGLSTYRIFDKEEEVFWEIPQYIYDEMKAENRVELVKQLRENYDKEEK